jgi:hypothetical protein
MFVKVLDGLYAGEIRDFVPHIAKELIAAGRAENPYAEPAVNVLPVTGTSQVGTTVKPAKPGRRSR